MKPESHEHVEFAAFVRWLANLGYTTTPPVNGAVLLKHRGRNIGRIWPSRTFVRLAAAGGMPVSARPGSRTPSNPITRPVPQKAQDKRVQQLLEDFRSSEPSRRQAAPPLKGRQPSPTIALEAAGKPRRKIPDYSKAVDKMWAAHERQKPKRAPASKETHGLQARRWKTPAQLGLE